MTNRSTKNHKDKSAGKLPVNAVSIPVIYLEWCDAIADSERWLSVKDAKDWGKNEDWIIKQVCFLLDETKEYMLLANRINPHIHTEDEIRVDGLLKLPKTWIRNRIDLSSTIS